jgi:hypothetical protein
MDEKQHSLPELLIAIETLKFYLKAIMLTRSKGIYLEINN